MKLTSTVLILLLFLNSCCDHFQLKDISPRNDKNSVFAYWVQEYKVVTFQRCLFLGYNRSPEIRNLLENDRSTAQDFPFGLLQYQYIDSIVQPIIKQAKIDSIQFYSKFLKGMNDIEKNELNGLPLIKYCLQFYDSPQLDSISNKRVEGMEYLWKNN